jgi:hypothetical protein
VVVAKFLKKKPPKVRKKTAGWRRKRCPPLSQSQATIQHPVRCLKPQRT